MKRALLAIAFVWSGCSAILNFDECTVDADCHGSGLSCTSDHLCVAGLPPEKLCTERLGAQPGNGTLMLAGLFRLSGPGSERDFPMADAARLAMMELKTLFPRPIGMVLCDTAGDLVQATHSLEVAARTYGAVGVVGPTTDDELVALAETVVSQGVLLITPSASGIAISALADQNLIWRTAGSDALEAPVLASLASGSVDIVYIDSSYGSSLLQALRSAGVSPIAARKFEPNSNVSDSVLSALRKDSPDSAILVADTDAPAIVQQLYVNENDPVLGATQFLFSGRAKQSGLIPSVPNAGVDARIRGTGPAAPSGIAFDTFRASYEATFPSESASGPFVASTYDAVYALALAAGSSVLSGSPVTGANLALAMTRMSTPNAKAIPVGPDGFSVGSRTLAAGMAIDLGGASGPLTWDSASGDVTDAPVEVWGIDAAGGFCTFDNSGNCQSQ